VAFSLTKDEIYDIIYLLKYISIVIYPRQKCGKKMYYVYVLKSLKDGKLYTGSTANLKDRLKDHAQGSVLATKGRRPLRLVYYEAFLNKTDASKEELFYKTGHGREVLKEKIEESVKAA
jgi:putative endonuclease